MSLTPSGGGKSLIPTKGSSPWSLLGYAEGERLFKFAAKPAPWFDDDTPWEAEPERPVPLRSSYAGIKSSLVEWMGLLASFVLPLCTAQ